MQLQLILSTRFRVVLLICIGFFIQYAQRINLPIAIVCMIDKTGVVDTLKPSSHTIHNNSRIVQRTFLLFKEQQFLWDEWDQQIILASYWIGYILTLIPSGWLSITMGAKRLCGISILISSLATVVLSSLYIEPNNAHFVIVGLRILIGAAHGVLFPASYYLLAQWAIPDERGTLTSIAFSGTNIGTSFIVLVGGLLCRYVAAGWIYTFFLPGILGFLWLLLWMWKVADSPEEHSSISKGECDYIRSNRGNNVQSKNRRPVSLCSLPWYAIFRSKPVTALFITEFCNLSGLFFFSNTFGKLLTEIHHIPIQSTGYILAIGFMFMLTGSVSSGMIADKLLRSGKMTLTNIRKLFNSLTSFIPCLCMVAFYFCDENRQILGVITVVLFLFSSGIAYGSGYIVNFSDIVPAYAGLIFGIATTGSSLGAVIGSIFAGILIKHPTLDDWRKLFILFFVSYFIGGLVYIIWGSAVPEKWATLASQTQEQTDTGCDEESVPIRDLTNIDESEETDVNA